MFFDQIFSRRPSFGIVDENILMKILSILDREEKRSYGEQLPTMAWHGQLRQFDIVDGEVGKGRLIVETRGDVGPFGHRWSPKQSTHTE